LHGFFLVALLLVSAGGLLFVVWRSLRRRRRIWFAGEPGGELMELTEQRSLLLRELKDAEAAVAAGKITQGGYDTLRARMMGELTAINTRLDMLRNVSRTVRQKLEADIAARSPTNSGDPAAAGRFRSVNQQPPAPMISLFILAAAALAAALAFAPAAYSQTTGTPDREPVLPKGKGIINIELVAKAGTIATFRGDQAAVAYLPDDHIPFDEFTQMSWSASFDSIIDPHRLPTEAEMALGGAKTRLMGSVYEANDSGIFKAEGLPAGMRLAVAVKHAGLWWPCRREFWFDEGWQEKTARIEVCAVSTDTSFLSAPEYLVQASVGMNSSTDLIWRPIVLAETITIENASRTHAVIGASGLNGTGWIRIPLTPPPGQPPASLTTHLQGEWVYSVGIQSAAPGDFDPRLAADIRPYRRWSRGTQWDDGAQDPHRPSSPHGQPNEARHYTVPGPKESVDAAHPLNEHGRFEFIGAGDVYLRTVTDSLTERVELVFNKPIPPASIVTIQVSQRPGISLDDPQPIQVVRLPFDFPVHDFRLACWPLLTAAGRQNLTLQGFERSPDAGQDEPARYRAVAPTNSESPQPAAPNPTAPVTAIILPGTPFGFELAPKPELREALIATAKQQRERADAEKDKDATAAAATAASSSSTGMSKEEAEAAERLARLLWFAAGVLGFAMLAVIVWAARAGGDKQRARLRKLPFTREEAVRELAELDEEFRRGRIGPATWKDERARLVGRLAESAADPSA
jgi:hypothetical protein